MARILITSALPYINGIKHLGNLAGSMLPADVWARFKRGQGHEVLYICATDEHGTLFPADEAFATRDFLAGLDHILANVCHLSAAVHEEAAVMAAVQLAFHSSTSRP